jgi:hypothetical protein
MTQDLHQPRSGRNKLVRIAFISYFLSANNKDVTFFIIINMSSITYRLNPLFSSNK